MPENIRAESEMEAELGVQVRLLEKACGEFDRGDYDETRNIARALRVILTSDSHGDASLLERAGYRDRKFPDTRILTHPRNISPEFSLTGIVFGSRTVGVRALLDDSGVNRWEPVAEWLEQIIADDKEGNFFSRHRLIKAVANLGGGTHYPSDIRDYYSKLEKVSISAEYGGKAASVHLRDVEKHSLRQIAFEVLSAFRKVDGKGVCAEPDALIIRSASMILYPGRVTHYSLEMKAKQAPGPLAQVGGHGFESIGGFMVKLPYEGTGRNAKCPCGSGLKFKNCCESAREFSKEFVDEFERRFSLGQYDKSRSRKGE